MRDKKAIMSMTQKVGTKGQSADYSPSPIMRGSTQCSFKSLHPDRSREWISRVRHLFIGIGVNLSEVPPVGDLEDGALHPVSLLSETGAAVSPEEFLGELAASYAQYEQQFVTYGFDGIRNAWLARAAKLGEVITARTGTSETTGTFETVDVDGNLVLNTAKGRLCIPAADVYF